MKVDCRILSLSWDSVANYIVVGCKDGTIRKWDVQKSQNMLIITLEKEERKSKTVEPARAIPWVVKHLRDGTILSGNSKGQTQIWDGEMGTLLFSFPSHQADILALCVDEEEKLFYTAGVDPTICFFVHSPQTKKWILSGNVKRLVTHDIRSLLLTSTHLIAAGLDTCLTRFKLSNLLYKSKARTTYPIPNRTPHWFSVCESQRLLLYYYSHTLQIWKLGQAGMEAPHSKTQPLKENYVPLYSFNFSLPILSAILAPSGKLLIVSFPQEIRAFRLRPGGEGIQKVSFPREGKKGVSLPPKRGAPLGVFSPDSAFFLLLLSDKFYLFDSSDIDNIRLLSVSPFQPQFIEEPLEAEEEPEEELSKKGKSMGADFDFGEILEIKLSHNGKYLAVLQDRYIHLLSFHPSSSSSSSLEYNTCLPRLTSPVTALEFSASGSSLIYVTAQQRLLIWDIELQQFSDWSRSLPPSHLYSITHKHTKTMGILTHPSLPDVVLLTGWGFLITIQTDLPWVHPDNFRKTKWRSILHSSLLSHNELVLIEKEWEKVEEHFPEVLYRKRYAT